MKIIAVVVTHHRLALLPRALRSICAQTRKPDAVFVISNSAPDSFWMEQQFCKDLGYKWIENTRTRTYTGALNTSIEAIIQQFGVNKRLYFASLDDDDEWLPTYLEVLERNNTSDFDVLIGGLLRKSMTENVLQQLPQTLSTRDFLIGNPGVCGSNTFIRLTTLLQAGGFDEAMNATADRDFWVRVFQQQPTYKILPQHLVTQHTDTDRPRITIESDKKTKSLFSFYYKYQHWMNETDKKQFFDRAHCLFHVESSAFLSVPKRALVATKIEIKFHNKGNYPFIIGFIAGDAVIAMHLIQQVVEQKIPVDKMVIIDNTPSEQPLSQVATYLEASLIDYKIVCATEWKANLKTGYYGNFFKKFTNINSIPLGRSLLQHHLFTETQHLEQPVYWILDDDMSFHVTVWAGDATKQPVLFDLINEHRGKVDAIVGAMSGDPPLPTLSCIRAQLLDFWHSYQANGSFSADHGQIQAKSDYYYDLSDVHTDHLEMPIYHSSITETDLQCIFSGKAVSRPSVQRTYETEVKTISRRGGNTLVFNRDLLQDYPVFNIQVHDKFARRGDLTWVLLNQLVEGKQIVEHTFGLLQNRPVNGFHLRRELEKSAYDIIGYAFNKGISTCIQAIQRTFDVSCARDIFDKIQQEDYYQSFLEVYYFYLGRRKTRFLMNYYRIMGLSKLLATDFDIAATFYQQVADVSMLQVFEQIMEEAITANTLKKCFMDFADTISTYSGSISTHKRGIQAHRTWVEQHFTLKVPLQILGSGLEGVVLSDGAFVYKSYHQIKQKDWQFLKKIAIHFEAHPFLESLDFYETEPYPTIRYRYQEFKPLERVDWQEMRSFVEFGRLHGFVFTNIKPNNFIQTLEGQVKLVDYGRSFEPFTFDKFLNSLKRAYLLHQHPTMDATHFQQLTARINRGEIPVEIQHWEEMCLTTQL